MPLPEKDKQMPLSENDLAVATHLGQLKAMVEGMVADVRDIKHQLQDPQSGIWARLARLEAKLPAIERQPVVRLSALAGGLAYVLEQLWRAAQALLHYTR
jgi:hypothetical protein